jgi:ABC-type ATPase with predicted acetyltransferase domain
MNNMAFIGRFVDMLHRGGPTEVDIWQCTACKDVVKTETKSLPVCHKCSTKGGG